MKGLEITIKKYSELLNNNHETIRLDAEHYQNKYQDILKKLNKTKSVELKTLLRQPVITGHTPSMLNSSFYGGNIKFIKTNNLRENYIINEYTHFLSKAGNDTRKNSQLIVNDVITTIIGATHQIIGRTAIIQEDILPANINQNIALIRVDSTKINPKYLNIYLNTYFGRGMLHYYSRQTEQVNLNCREIEYILVPIFKNLENKIESIVKTIESIKILSQQKYAAAEALLLQTLGLNNFNPPNQAISIKSFNESFGSTGRLDAEYYQPKYDNLIAHIKNQTWCYLSELVNITKSIEPGSSAYDENAGVPFYRVSDYSKAGLSTPNKKLQNSFVKQNQKLINSLKPKKNTILFSKDGSIGNAYLLTQDLDGITSGAILHLNVKDNAKIIPEYLTLLLNSNIVKLQAERDAGGSIILHWSIKEIENVIIPIIDLNVQNQIADLIKESFTLKEQSEHLLEVVKKAVEIAIEQNETIAIDFIDDNS